jgi:RNA exonuclease NGL2
MSNPNLNHLPAPAAKQEPFVMTDEMLAKQEARKQAKQAKKAAKSALNGGSETASGATTPGTSQILRRDWKYLSTKETGSSMEGKGHTLRLLTWNMLAQTLVRKYVTYRQDSRSQICSQEEISSQVPVSV